MQTLKSSLVTILLLFGTILIQAQELSNTEKDEILQCIIEKIEKAYPFSEISKKTIKGLNEQISQDFYDKYNSPNEFTTQVTISLKNFSNDKHFNLSYNPSLAKALIDEESTDKSDTAYTAEEAKSEAWNNYGFKELSILDGNIGYLNLSVFFATQYAGKAADIAMNYFSNCNALIIDLRQNGGGWGDMVDYLLGYFVDNKDPILISIDKSTLDSSYYSSVIPCYVQGQKLTNIPIYILTSSGTASAAEGFTSHMKFFNKNVTTVGVKTSGSENPIDNLAINENFDLRIPCWKRVYSSNPTKWEGVGIKPDIEVETEGAKRAHLLALEKLIANTTDDFTISKFQWAIDGLKADYNNITKSDMQKIKGDYYFFHRYFF